MKNHSMIPVLIICLITLSGCSTYFDKKDTQTPPEIIPAQQEPENISIKAPEPTKKKSVETPEKASAKTTQPEQNIPVKKPVQQASIPAEKSITPPSLLSKQDIQKKSFPPLPDFSAISPTKKKKRAFFNFMNPIIKAENQHILNDRKKIQTLASQSVLTHQDKTWLKQLARQYELDSIPHDFSPLFFQALLKRVDIIPVSLALAQSANESAWGTSRFAVEGNNLYGQWCFFKGCGIVPSKRPEGKTYEVRQFDDVADSVRAYMINLNTHNAYKSLRTIRQSLRQQKKTITGPALAEGLTGYSIRGVAYVNELISMIKTNHLIKYDRKS